MTDPVKAKKTIEQLLRANRKVQAVGYAKVAFSVSWKEAHQLVDAVAKELGIEVAMIPKQSGCISSALLIICWFFFASAILSFAVAGINYYLHDQMVNNGSPVSGKVIKLIPHDEGNPDEQSFAPVIAYTWEGEEKEYQGNYFSNPPAYYVGQELTLFVNPDDPDEILIDSFDDRWLGIIVLAGVGGFLLFLAILAYVFSRKLK